MSRIVNWADPHEAYAYVKERAEKAEARIQNLESEIAGLRYSKTKEREAWAKAEVAAQARAARIEKAEARVAELTAAARPVVEALRSDRVTWRMSLVEAEALTDQVATLWQMVREVPVDSVSNETSKGDTRGDETRTSEEGRGNGSGSRPPLERRGDRGLGGGHCGPGPGAGPRDPGGVIPRPSEASPKVWGRMAHAESCPYRNDEESCNCHVSHPDNDLRPGQAEPKSWEEAVADGSFRESLRSRPDYACTCGSGAHPRRCRKHPEGYDAHCADLDVEAALQEIETWNEDGCCAICLSDGGHGQVWAEELTGNVPCPVGRVRASLDKMWSKPRSETAVPDAKRLFSLFLQVEREHRLPGTMPSTLLSTWESIDHRDKAKWETFAAMLASMPTGSEEKS